MTLSITLTYSLQEMIDIIVRVHLIETDLASCGPCCLFLGRYWDHVTSFHCDKLVCCCSSRLLLAGYCGNHLLLLLLCWNFPRLLLDNNLHKKWVRMNWRMYNLTEMLKKKVSQLIWLSNIKTVIHLNVNSYPVFFLQFRQTARQRLEFCCLYTFIKEMFLYFLQWAI